MKPRLLLDVDGVLADFTNPVLEFLRTVGIDKSYEDICRWDIFEGNSELEDEFKESYASHPGYCYNLKPLPGAIDFVRSARKSYDISIVTTPYDVPYWYNERKDWIVDNFGLSRSCITFTHHKEFLEGDIFVDDKLENVERWSKNWSHRKKTVPVVFDQPWNRSLVSKEIVRTRNWIELSDKLIALDFPSIY